MIQTHTLTCGESFAVLVIPESGLYEGVRFDRAGVFQSIRFHGRTYSGRWLDGPEDPFRHDNVTGPVEEFSAQGYEEATAGDGFLKIGVGLLQKTSAADYDFTARYPLLNGGERSCELAGDSALFRQQLIAGQWGYDYTKQVGWEKEGVLFIRHHLENTGAAPLDGTVYNHNFFTFDDIGTGVGTAVDLPFTPAGEWRRWPGDLPVGELTRSGIRLTRPVTEGGKICITHLGTADGAPMPYLFEVRNTLAGLGVRVSGDIPLCRIQFWGNHRVACMEPFSPVSLAPGSALDWTLTYVLV